MEEISLQIHKDHIFGVLERHSGGIYTFTSRNILDVLGNLLGAIDMKYDRPEQEKIIRKIIDDSYKRRSKHSKKIYNGVEFMKLKC